MVVSHVVSPVVVEMMWVAVLVVAVPAGAALVLAFAVPVDVALVSAQMLAGVSVVAAVPLGLPGLQQR